jgi:flagellar basal body rod protein FlgC
VCSVMQASRNAQTDNETFFVCSRARGELTTSLMSYQPKLQQQTALAKFDDCGASRRQDAAVKDLLQHSVVAPAAAAHDVIYEPEHQAADWSGFVAKVAVHIDI